jgi:hypothetical protein
MWAYQTITNDPWPRINSELLLVSAQYSFSYNSQIKCFRTHVYIDTFSYVGIWKSCPKFVRTFHLHPIYSNNHYSGTCYVLHVTIICRHVTAVIVAVH